MRRPLGGKRVVHLRALLEANTAVDVQHLGGNRGNGFLDLRVGRVCLGDVDPVARQRNNLDRLIASC